MKKLLSIFSFVFIFSALSAQQIPNGSFQYWSSTFAPDGWGTWASAISFLNTSTADSLARLSVKDTASGDYITDSATLKLTVDTVSLPFQGVQTLAGFASLGGAFYIAPPGGVGLEFGYLPYFLKPDTLYFDYKFIPATGFNDTALIAVVLTKWDTLSHSRWLVLSMSVPLSSSPQWQRNTAYPMAAYYNSALPDTLQPDSMQVIIYSSVSAAPSLGTTLWIDSLHFDASVNPIATGVPDLNTLKGVSIYPNPADDKLHIAIAEREVGDKVRIYNASGQQVFDGSLDKQITIVDTQALPSGVYTLRILGHDRLTVYKGCFSVAH